MAEEKRAMRKWIWILIGAIVLALLIAGLYGYKAMKKDERKMITLSNPASGLSVEEAASKFNESFVLYLLASIGAQDLHKTPLGNEKPKIEIKVDEKFYGAVVDDGAIGVFSGNADGKDILITTTALEAVKMMNSRDYIAESFKAGNSRIQLSAGKATLFGKGYLSLYQKLTGESITGSFLK